MVWAAVSRAIRTPSALDASMQFDIGGFITPEGLPVIFRLQGNPRIENENLTAYEVGYRTQWRDRLTLDIAAYYNSYDHLLTTETTTPFMETSPPPLHTVQALLTENLMAAETQGAEVSANWKITDRWSLSPRYAFEQVHARLDRSSHDVPSLENVEGVTPAHWARIDSLVRISRDLLWNTDLTFVDRLTLGNVPSYNRLDTQLTWHFSEKAALTLAGQNLLRDHHLEIVDPATGWPSSLVKRSGSVKFTWWF